MTNSTHPGPACRLFDTRTRGQHVKSNITIRLSPSSSSLSPSPHYNTVQDFASSDSPGIANDANLLPTSAMSRIDDDFISRAATDEELLVIMPYEAWWRDRYDLLLSRGYQLRPRLRPGWVPSWTTNGKEIWSCEDSAYIMVFSTYPSFNPGSNLNNRRLPNITLSMQ